MHLKSFDTFLPIPCDANVLADRYPMYWLRDLYIQGCVLPEIAIHRLLSNSPFLERFSVADIRETHKLKIVLPLNLKFFKITQSPEYCSLKYIEISSFSSSDHHHQNQHPILNLMEMEMDTCHPPSANIKINISAPNLSYLMIRLWEEFKFDSYRTLLPQIKRLHLCICSEPTVFSTQDLTDMGKAAWKSIWGSPL
ncbi:uncharacterized protein LOC112491814 isoform X2 [Ziziphus jujuba]|uniref:Uncharacterized protein LOC112491814 isoform X2 n=1 Tax=Ziziphus jujuba TaxID=326968 RepID=A0ABM3IK59_ZIZJJ|nr:uncharacterized protein LOC112491814 isoform X2 [Ziziphus jujuba]